MGAQLKSVINFKSVAPGQTATLPHLLQTSGGRMLVPDLIELTNPDFDVVRDFTTSTHVTVINNGTTIEDCDAYCEYWQQITGIDPEERLYDPSPTPLVTRSALSGVSSGGSYTKVLYTAQGTEGTDFNVSIGKVMPSSYDVLWAPKGVVAVPTIDLPNGDGDRTTTQFRVLLNAPLHAGDTLIFILFT